MSAKAKKKGKSKTSQRKGIRESLKPIDSRAVMDALQNDDPQALNAAIAGRNPLRLSFVLTDGNTCGIRTVASALGAWACHLDLIDNQTRWERWLSDLEGKAQEDHLKDNLGSSYFMGAAMDAKTQGAIDVHRRQCYLAIKKAGKDGRNVLSSAFKGDAHFSDALQQVISEEESAKLSDQITTNIHQEATPKQTGGKARGL